MSKDFAPKEFTVDTDANEIEGWERKPTKERLNAALEMFNARTFNEAFGGYAVKAAEVSIRVDYVDDFDEDAFNAAYDELTAA